MDIYATKNPMQRHRVFCFMGKREDERKLSDLICLGLFDLKTSCRRNLGGLLRHSQSQDAVVILSGDTVSINTFNIETAAERSVITLAAYKTVVALVFLFLGLALRGNGQAILVDINVDIFLLEAGQFIRRITKMDILSRGKRRNVM